MCADGVGHGKRAQRWPLHGTGHLDGRPERAGVILAYPGCVFFSAVGAGEKDATHGGNEEETH